MYSLQESDIYRLISACQYYMSQTSSEDIYDEYSRIHEKLKNYISQNFPELSQG
jgi:hypothetical protein